MPKGEPAGRRIQLKTAETQIKQDAVNTGKPVLAGDPSHLIKWRLAELQSAGADFVRKALLNSLNGRGVNIQPQYSPTADRIFAHLAAGEQLAGARMTQQALRMAAAAQCTIDEASARLDVQTGQHFLQQNGRVLIEAAADRICCAFGGG